MGSEGFDFGDYEVRKVQAPFCPNRMCKGKQLIVIHRARLDLAQYQQKVLPCFCSRKRCKRGNNSKHLKLGLKAKGRVGFYYYCKSCKKAYHPSHVKPRGVPQGVTLELE